MPRVALEVAAARRARVLELHQSGMKPAQIAREVGIAVASVQHYIRNPRPDLDERALAVQAAVEIRRGNPVLSGHEIPDRYALSVSQATLYRRFASEGLTTARRAALNRRRYWMDSKPLIYLDMVQLDTVKLRDSQGVLREYLSARDVWSGCHVLMPHDASESGMLRSIRRIFAVFGGIPRVIQADNGTTDFSPARRNRLRPWHKFAFAAGVSRVQFIPEAEPHRNGSVESFHAWLKSEYDASYVSGDLDAWIVGRLHYYNFRRRLRTTRVIPADRSGGCFSLERDALDLSLDESRWQSGQCCISYIRLALRDRECGATLAVVRNPACVFALPADFEGSYLRFDVYADRGEVWMSKVCEGELDARKVDGRFQAGAVGVNVGSFVSPFQSDAPVVVPALTDSPSDPVFVDTAGVVRRWARVLKQPCPTLLPSGYEVRHAGGGVWEVWYRGELVWTEQASPEVIEHAREVL